MLGVLGAGFGQRQQERKNGDDEGDRLTLFFRLDRGFGGFRHELTFSSSGAANRPREVRRNQRFSPRKTTFLD